jgi:RimJ/RimL family protein N-acetyltransferase
MQLATALLEDRFVRLEPLDERWREGLRAACAADQTVWRELYPYSMIGEAFDAAWTRLMSQRDGGQTLPFAVIAGDRCVGLSCYLAIAPSDRTVEIGGTYYAPEARGGAVNPAAKRLLLGHAFDAGALRVQLNVDAINARSRAAVLKLGAVQEGILRSHRITWTGRIRDTAVYSILADEWPAVRAGLDARLAAFG